MDEKIIERLEELVEDISYEGYHASIPEESLNELNDLTKNGWTQEEYKEFILGYESRSTLEETVYALLHNGEYPNNMGQHIYFWKNKKAVALSDKQIVWKLDDLPETVDEDFVCDFDDLPVREFYEWFCTHFSEWSIEEEVDEEELQSGSFEVCFDCGDIAYARFKYVTLEAYGNKMINIMGCNLCENEKQEILAFANKYQLHIFEDEQEIL